MNSKKLGFTLLMLGVIGFLAMGFQNCAKRKLGSTEKLNSTDTEQVLHKDVLDCGKLSTQIALGEIAIKENLSCQCTTENLTNLQSVWGVQSYYYKSDICGAAKKSGLLNADPLHVITIAPGNQCSYFAGIFSNEVLSLEKVLSFAEPSFYLLEKGEMPRCDQKVVN